MSEYAKNDTLTRTKDDLSVVQIENLPIEIKTITFEPDGIINMQMPHVPFHEGAHLIGKIGTTEFDLIFKTKGINDSFTPEHLFHQMYVNDFLELNWDEVTNALTHAGSLQVTITSATIEKRNTLALKSDLDEYQLKSNTTITHYCPIEGNIDDFVVGAPVYLTGKVYKYDKEFVPSTSNDTIDCICSVKTNGTWKEYVGICTSIDTKNNCLTFASGGDYMVKVTDSSCYNIGDQVFIDDDNKLKILAGATAITAKIQRMTIGIVTGIIDKNILAVFK